MNEFVSISELTKAEKIKPTFCLFDSSVMLQIAARVCTLRSLIDRGCGGGGRKKYQNLIVEAVGIVQRVRKK